jgi:cytosine/adenosine deaminase-related metal-dependent hydrolase
LKWGDGIEIEHKRAVEKNYPFITHLEEGFDEESQQGVEILEKLNCLDDYDILIHCIGFSKEDISKVKEAGAHIGWCPASNMFMFNVTCRIREILDAGINVSIGTDSTHTGSFNLLEEMRYARALYRKMYGQDLAAKDIVKMVTTHPAKAFRMDKEIGSIEEGKRADLLLIEPTDKDPYEALVKMEPKDIQLLLWKGEPILGDVRYKELFENTKQNHNTISLMGSPKLVKGDPAGLLKRIRNNVGFKKDLDFMPLEVQNV